MHEVLSIILILLFHLGVYAFPSILGSLLKEKKRAWLNFIYVGVLFVLVQLFDNLYGVPILELFSINGGDIAYTALIFASLYIIVSQPDAEVVRNLIYVVSTLSVFLFLLFGVIRWTIGIGLIVNYLDIPSVFLEYSFKSLVLTLFLYSSEVMVALFLIRWIYKKSEGKFTSRGGVFLSYYIVVILDGIVYPLGYNFLSIGNELSVSEGVYSKLVFGMGFGIILFLLLGYRPGKFIDFLTLDIPFIEFLLPPHYHNLRKKLEEAEKEIKVLKDILPLCSYCKKIRDEQGNWYHIEQFVEKSKGVAISHVYCDECIAIELSNL